MSDTLTRVPFATFDWTSESPPSGRSSRAGIGREAAHRMLDIVVALGVIVFLAPLFILVALLVFAEDRGPIFYRQERIGRGGRRFGCIKFRSMAVDADRRLAEILACDAARAEWSSDFKLRRDPRVTRVGAFLRKWSLDELTQVFNVLCGHMSIVGPRPIVPGEVERYGRFFNDYCKVRPGITGLWQVSGRNDVSYRRRVALDALYARSKTLRLDLAILLMTIPAVLTQRGSY